VYLGGAVFFRDHQMKEITEDLLIKASKNSPNDVKTIILRRLGIGGCGTTVVSHVECVDLSNNDLQTMIRLFHQFPSGWWFNLSGNTVSHFSHSLLTSSLDH
jgi:hypothetical protein